MVYSNLNSSILYKDKLELNPEDKGHLSSQYNLELFGETFTIVLGKLNTIYADKDVVFYPIYFLRKKQIQIGVYELESKRIQEVLDDDGDLDLEKVSDPLLYSFVDEAFIKKLMTEKPETKKSDDEPSKKPEEPVPEKVKEETEEDRVIKVKIPESKKSEQLDAAEKKLDSGIYEIDPQIVPPEPFEEETAERANALKKEYKEKKGNPWIAKFMKNNHFGIHEVETNGDCFFGVVRDALKQIGKITTVNKLRAVLAEEFTDEMFQDRRTVYLSLMGDVHDKESEMTAIKQNLNSTYRTRIEEAKKQKDKIALKKLQEEENKEKRKYSALQEQKNLMEKFIEETVGDISEVDTLEKFRAYIQTPNFWADSWAIGTIEYRLNIKMIILSHRAYNEKSLDNVMDCGEINKHIQDSGKFNPTHYIMTSFSGNHFKLVTYKDRRIFKFHEIPFYVKNLILNKCLEKSAGPFYVISDFQSIMKTKLGKETGKSEKEPDLTHGDLYNENRLLIFGLKASKSANPGKMSGEKIPKEEMKLFLPLHRNAEWRRKLDDMYEAQFNLDGHKWLSVEHYYQGAKFKNGFPDFSLQFSLDSDSEISKSADLATDAGGPSGKKKGQLLRPKNVVVDPTFYGDRSAQTRENALHEKFSQNEDLKQILLATRDAKLAHFIRGDEPEVDIMLMRIRRKLG